MPKLPRKRAKDEMYNSTVVVRVDRAMAETYRKLKDVHMVNMPEYCRAILREAFQKALEKTEKAA